MTTYYKAAEVAYNLVLKGEDFETAWKKAVAQFTISVEVIKKGCPKQSFIGLCEEGKLIGIAFSKESKSVNFAYIYYALKEWKKNKDFSKSEIREKVKAKFNNECMQGQLDVAQALIPYFVE